MNHISKILKTKLEPYIRQGSFQLKSGNYSSYYYDIKSAMCNPFVFDYISRAIYDQLEGEDVINVGGMLFGATPIIASMCHLGEYNAFYVRKQTQAHGLGGQIISDGKVTGKTVIIDDVISTGSTIDDCIRILHDEGHNPEIIYVLCVVDRTNGSYTKYPIRSLFKEQDFATI